MTVLLNQSRLAHVLLYVTIFQIIYTKFHFVFIHDEPVTQRTYLDTQVPATGGSTSFSGLLLYKKWKACLTLARRLACGTVALPIFNYSSEFEISRDLPSLMVESDRKFAPIQPPSSLVIGITPCHAPWHVCTVQTIDWCQFVETR